jgi:UDP-3-O-[3-hydroxymyristoyl] N-acetylglucosamine deacetylase
MTFQHDSPRKQTTLRRPFTVRGAGMHTGRHAEVTVRPSPADSGIVFLCGARRIPARASFVVSTRRCTCLGEGDAQLHTIEHVTSALAGLGVDNAEITVDGPEVPILDGSGLPWVEEIRAAGIETLDKGVQPIVPRETVALRDGDSWLVAAPAERFSLTCVTHFDHPLLGTTAGTFGDDPEEFAREIAPSRTFGFIHEVEALRAAGLAQGGSVDNALVIYEDRFSSPLRVPDEWLRHKALDLYGDLSLAGGPIQAAITAVMPGHRINTRFAALLAENAARPGG